MLIGICGGICSGKKTVAQYLVDHHGFQRLYLDDDDDDRSHNRSSNNSASASTSANGTRPPAVKPTPTPRNPHHTFPTADALLDFVTKRWRDRYVTTDVHDEAILDLLSRRPFFILVSPQNAARDVALDRFVALSDAHLYDPAAGLQPLISRATVRLLNTSESLAHLYATLGKLDLANPDRLRPSWDSYFMSLASLAAQRSNCMKRRVGCVLVGRERRVISTGYNGTPAASATAPRAAAPAATTPVLPASAFPPASASTPRRTPCSRLEGRGSAKAPCSTAILAHA
ncbi:unnamed protein product [Parascedosporium putredinis]|uniref:dCMP deaminase n=1 Tax=Parascedosporium putredinis TaxID=1442378 RepID=A0A9P1GXP7_9PEZI|nr:unnamed protein product [Parascedosporium putredinis]CAI7990017.1 unnamed protein product [Parascedosporium putredinis]